MLQFPIFVLLPLTLKGMRGLISHLFLCLQNELAILEFIHLLVETMDRHFGNVVSY